MKDKDWNAKLDQMKTLKKGWDSYKAVPPSLEVIESVREFVKLKEPDRVEPSCMGGIGVTYYKGDLKAYVEFYNKGNIATLLVDENDLDGMKVLKANDFTAIIEEIEKFLV